MHKEKIKCLTFFENHIDKGASLPSFRRHLVPLLGGNSIMCGIVGYIGNQDSKEILIKGLEKLEYRGYDSAGIAVVNENGVRVFKEKGRIADLRKVVDFSVQGNTGIGHTRWATHGVPSTGNAHPHQSASGTINACS